MLLYSDGVIIDVRIEVKEWYWKWTLHKRATITASILLLVVFDYSEIQVILMFSFCKKNRILEDKGKREKLNKTMN